jgi:hypothetical protein
MGIIRKKSVVLVGDIGSKWGKWKTQQPPARSLALPKDLSGLVETAINPIRKPDAAPFNPFYPVCRRRSRSLNSTVFFCGTLDKTLFVLRRKMMKKEGRISGTTPMCGAGEPWRPNWNP